MSDPKDDGVHKALKDAPAIFGGCIGGLFSPLPELFFLFLYLGHIIVDKIKGKKSS